MRAAPDAEALPRLSRPLRIRACDIHLLQAPISPPVQASFGQLAHRNALLVALRDDEGHEGWGEIWCTLPEHGGRHRAALLEQVAVPLLLGQPVADIPALRRALVEACRPIVRLAGEAGPVSQVLAGVDCALWDLAARRAGQPLYRLLGGQAATMETYASGLAPAPSPATLQALRAQGFRAFKFKCGFDDARTLAQLIAQADALAPGEHMMIDANCGWSLPQALAATRALAQRPLEWMEEPLGPERPAAEWQALQAAGAPPLAAGENLVGRAAFEHAFAWLGVVQPDLGKWGGISGVVPLARRILAAGRRFCPHAFGTRVGQLLAAHVLAAVGGDGRLELDANDNPLRALGAATGYTLQAGRFRLDDQAPGIGFTPDADALARHRILHRTRAGA